MDSQPAAGHPAPPPPPRPAATIGRRERGPTSALESALVISGAYALASAAWIWGSDWLLSVTISPATPEYRTVSSLKGFLFVAVTAVLLFWLVFRSVARQSRARERARLSERRLREAASAANSAPWTVDLRTGLIERDLNLDRIIAGDGPPLPQSIAEWNRYVHPEDFEVARASWESCVSGLGVRYHTEHRVLRRDGSVGWVLVQGSSVPGPDGRPAKVTGVTTDMTEVRLARRERDASETRLRQIADSLPGAVYQTTAHPGGRISCDYVSAGVAELIGETPEAILSGQTCTADRVHPEDREEHRARLREALRAGSPLRHEYRLLHRDGGVRWVRDVARPTLQSDGSTVWHGVMLDISDFKALGAEAEAARARLRESEARYRELVEGVRTIAWEVDLATFRFTFVSGAAESTLGYPVEAWYAPDFWVDHLHPDDRDRAVRYCQEQTAAGRGHQFEYRMIAADGRVVWFQDLVSIVADTGRPVALRGVLVDITERKRAEEELERFFSLAPAMLCVADLGGFFKRVNPAFCAALGYTEGELRARPFVDFIHPDDRAATAAEADAAARGRPSPVFENRYLHKDGRYRVLSWRSTVDPQARLILASARDVTDEKRAAEEVRRSRARLAAIIDNTPNVAIEGYGADGRVQFWNHAAERIFGWTREEAVGRSLDQIMLDRPGAERFAQTLRDIDRSGVPAGPHEWQFTARDGSRGVCLSTIFAVGDPAGGEGEERAYVCVDVDITERKRAELWREGEGRVLELLAANASLERVLSELVLTTESHEPGALCAVLLLDAEGTGLRTCVAPGLPDSYCRAVDALPLTARAGPGASAVRHRRRVVVTDIATDPLCDGMRGLADAHGIRACWAEPILSAEGSPIGAFAMHYRSSRAPSERETQLLEDAARLAGLAIERTRAETSLRESESRLRLAMRAGAMGAWERDLRTQRITWSDEVYQILGVPRDGFDGAFESFLKIVHPADEVHLRKAVADALANGEYRSEFRVIRPGGDFTWLEGRGTLFRDDGGQPVRLAGVVIDVTERKRAEEALRRSEATQRALLQAIPDLMFRMDRRAVYLDYHAPVDATLLTGRDGFIGRRADEVLPPSVGLPTVKAVTAAIATGEPQLFEYESSRPGGERKWWEVRVVKSGHDEALCLVRDITERRTSQKHQDLMMAELDHRVKNNLAAVISLADQTGAATSTFEGFHEAFMNRLRALGRMHSVLASARWRGADLGNLVRQTLEAFGGEGTRRYAQGPSLLLSARASQSIAITLNELATNAAKYGSLSVPGGAVEVTWRIDEPGGAPDVHPTLRFSWVESGGPRIEPPSRRGFGSELIEGAISYELKGIVSLNFDPSGVRCSIEIPLDPAYVTPEAAAPATALASDDSPQGP